MFSLKTLLYSEFFTSLTKESNLSFISKIMLNIWIVINIVLFQNISSALHVSEEDV